MIAKTHTADAPLAVVTGATAGLGLETAKGLAAAGYRVVIAARSEERGRLACHAVRSQHPHAQVRFELLDLDSLDSVHAFAELLRQQEKSLARLINNAGLLAPDRKSTRLNSSHVSESRMPSSA